MSLDALAELLDTLASSQGVLITETAASLVASALDARCAARLAKAVARLQWDYQLVDSANNSFTVARLDDDFAPFRLTLHKVLPKDDGALYLLSATGLADALARGQTGTCWRLARLRSAFVTQARVFGNWVQPLAFTPAPPTRSPRALVRETAADRRVPQDVREWLLVEDSPLDLSDPLQALWATKAFDALTRSLANELDSAAGTLLFRGPPALQLPEVDVTAEELHAGGTHSFLQLQAAARWVYEWSREAELRHAMLATEIARSGRDADNRASYLGAHLGNALEGAKVVYQLHLSDITLDTLNALSTLRGNVSDDAARTTESIQQALTKVAAALGVGLTIVASRIGNDISPWMIMLVMGVACAYCLLELLAGWRLIGIRRSARTAWQPRFYRFLPPADFARMVTRPALRSERVYLWATGIGFALVLLLSLVVVACGFLQPDASGSARDSVPESGTLPANPGQAPMPYPPAQWSTSQPGWQAGASISARP